MTTHLTDTQKQTIRIALAKWEGWKRHSKAGAWLGCWVNPEGEICSRSCENLPNYPASLDACHAVEVKLTDEEHKQFEAQLRHLTKVSKGIICSDKDHRDFVSASAERRALALFRALNLGELGD